MKACVNALSAALDRVAVSLVPSAKVSPENLQHKAHVQLTQRRQHAIMLPWANKAQLLLVTGMLICSNRYLQQQDKAPDDADLCRFMLKMLKSCLLPASMQTEDSMLVA